MRHSPDVRLPTLLVSGFALLAACNALFGVDALSYEPSTPAGGQGGLAATAGHGGTSGAGGGGGQATGGQGGSAGGSPVPTGTVMWSRRFGGVGTDAGQSVAIDLNGNIVVAGTFQGSVDFGQGTLTSVGGRDVFLLQLDPQGVTVWSKSFGGFGDENVGSVDVDQQGNIGLAGDFRQFIDFGGAVLQGDTLPTSFTATFSPLGNHLYSAEFGNKGFFDVDTTRAISLATDNFVVVGAFSGSADFGGGNLYAGQVDVFVAKLSTSGVHQWSADYGADNTQIAQAVALDSSANVLLTGDFKNNIKFGDDKLNSKGDYDMFVAKLDPAGQASWSLSFGDGKRQQGLAIAVDAADNVIVGGNLQGAVDFGGGQLVTASENKNGIDDIYLLKLDSTGKHLFSARYGDEQDQDLRGLAVDLDNNILLTGALNGTAHFGGVSPVSSVGSVDIYIVKLDPDGKHLWSHSFGSTGEQVSFDVAASPFGEAVVTGAFENTLDFGENTKVLTAKGQGDIFVVKLEY